MIEFEYSNRQNYDKYKVKRINKFKKMLNRLGKKKR